MAIKKNERVNGRIGNTLHYQLGEKDIIKIVPAHMTNPRTSGQVNQRTKIKTASRFVKAVHKFILIGYQATTLDYPSNEARQYLLKNCFIIGAGGPVLDYQKVKISRGLLKQPEETVFTINENIATITWKKPVKGDFNDDEKAMIALYWEEVAGDKTEGRSLLINNGTRRRDGSISFEIPEHPTPINVWLFFYDPEGAIGESKKKISDSAWVGSVPF